jgi:hypothetical protein
MDNSDVLPVRIVVVDFSLYHPSQSFASNEFELNGLSLLILSAKYSLG